MADQFSFAFGRSCRQCPLPVAVVLVAAALGGSDPPIASRSAPSIALSFAADPFEAGPTGSASPIALRFAHVADPVAAVVLVNVDLYGKNLILQHHQASKRSDFASKRIQLLLNLS